MKNKKSSIILTLSFLILLSNTSCAPLVRYKAFEPSEAPKSLIAIVDIYDEEQLIPPDSIVLGEINIDDTGFSTGCDLETLISIVKEKARQIGADGAFLVRVTKPDRLGTGGSSCYRLVARLLKYKK